MFLDHYWAVQLLAGSARALFEAFLNLEGLVSLKRVLNESVKVKVRLDSSDIFDWGNIRFVSEDTRSHILRITEWD